MSLGAARWAALGQVLRVDIVRMTLTFLPFRGKVARQDTLESSTSPGGHSKPPLLSPGTEDVESSQVERGSQEVTSS
jgi:hypothetical protein